MIGEDYAHGTGHGVGQYLGVHEGPHSLKNIVTPPFVEGNLMSIEPGHYESRQVRHPHRESGLRGQATRSSARTARPGTRSIR